MLLRQNLLPSLSSLSRRYRYHRHYLHIQKYFYESLYARMERSLPTKEASYFLRSHVCWLKRADGKTSPVCQESKSET
jgi:hypothetical protein